MAFFRFLILDGGWPYHRVFENRNDWIISQISIIYSYIDAAVHLMAFFRFLIFDGGWPYHRVFFLSENRKWSLRRTRNDWIISQISSTSIAGVDAAAHLMTK